MINQGTAARLYKDQIINIGYFKASITNLNGFKYGKKVCESCETEQKVFIINPNLHPNPAWICIDCLQNLEIITTHNSDFGFVDINLPGELKEENASNHVTEEMYLELIKTPPFLNLQGERWLTHCDDFMDYIGTWEAPDFSRESEDGNGRKLFLAMTEEEYQHLWDTVGLAKDETEYSWEDCLYHTFKCRHCEIKLGYWECF